MNDADRNWGRFGSQLEALQARLDDLRAGVPASPTTELVEQTLAELAVSVEELQVADEELRQQADELAVAAEMLEAERRHYQDLFEFAPDGYLVTDAHGNIREANRAAGELLGKAPNRLRSKPLTLYVVDTELRTFRAKLLGARQGQAVWDTRIKGPEGEGRHVECTVAPIRDPATGAVHELRWRLHDVTERKQAEVDLRQSRQTLRELSGRHEAVREEERATMARAVHDEIGAALTAIKMDLAQIRHGLDKLAGGQNGIVMLRERTATAAQLIDETMQKVRSIAMELRPAILDDFGLVAALDWQLNEFQKRSGLRCELSVAPGDGRLPKATATAVFRVFQEILTNVARHAEATEVKAHLRQEGADLVLDVRDNGRGIREAEAKGAGSLGLVGMRERVRLQGGTVEVTGKPGTGTLVRVRVPVGDADPGAPPAGG